MKYIKQILGVVTIFGLLFLSGYQYYNNYNLKKLLAIGNSTLQESKLEIGRAKTEITDQRNLNAQLVKFHNSFVKKEIKKRSALVTSYGELEALYETEKKKQKLTTKIVYKDKIIGKVIDLPKGKIFVRDKDGNYNEIKHWQFSFKDFRIDVEGDCVKEQFSYKLHQKFKVKFIETKLPTGAVNNYVELHEIDKNGKEIIKLKVTRFEVLKSNLLSSRMTWWNPKLDLNLGMGINSKLEFNWLGELGLSISSYGKTTNDLSWKFFRFGIGMTKTGFSLTLSPAQFNLGTLLPVVSNLYIVPTAGYDLVNQSYHFGLGFSVGL